MTIADRKNYIYQQNKGHSKITSMDHVDDSKSNYILEHIHLRCKSTHHAQPFKTFTYGNNCFSINII